MDTDRNKTATRDADIGVNAGIATEARLAFRGSETAEITIGFGPELIIDRADIASLERLPGVATEGARLLRVWIAENRITAVRERAGHTDGLVGVGVTR